MTSYKMNEYRLLLSIAANIEKKRETSRSYGTLNNIFLQEKTEPESYEVSRHNYQGRKNTAQRDMLNTPRRCN